MSREAFLDATMVSMRRALISAYEAGRIDEREAKASNGPAPLFPPKVTIEGVLAAVSQVSGIADFRRNDTGSRAHQDERYAAIVLLRELCGLSSPHIARLLGYADHTTVLRAARIHATIPGVVRIVEDARGILIPERAA